MSVTELIPSYLTPQNARSLWDLFYIILLASARMIPIVVMTPFLGGKTMGNVMKVGFGIALGLIFFPYLLVHKASITSFDMPFFFLLIKELMVGLFLGFLISMPFYIVSGAGSLIDHQAGAQSLQVTDPSTQIQTSPLGQLYNNVLIVLFFIIGGPLLFFDAVLTSYQVFPADSFISAHFFSHDIPFTKAMIRLLNVFMVMTVQFAAPPVLAMLMSDLFLGIANRMAPQVQISFLLWALKAYAGLIVIWAGWWLVLRQMEIEGIAWVKMMQNLLQGVKGIVG